MKIKLFIDEDVHSSSHETMLRKIAAPTLVLLIITFLLYNWIKTLPETADISSTATEISVETGESIFWGKGRCHVCHRVGTRGYALRGPNLGESKDGELIAMRAQNRAVELGLSKGTDYLVQSIAKPATFLVPGFQNEMPEVFKAPITLTPSEIKAVILYLQSLGGTVNADEIQLPPELLSAYRKPEASTKLKAKGDVEAGRILFFYAQGPAACAACHIGTNSKGHPEGSSTGPDLTAIASIRNPQFILREILHPDSLIVSGYETTLIKTADGRLITGIVQDEDKENLVVIQTNRHPLTIGKNYIKNRSIQNISMMPNNYQELLTQRQLDDLMAYLLTLTGE